MKYYGIKRKKRKEEIEFIYAKANAKVRTIYLEKTEIFIKEYVN